MHPVSVTQTLVLGLLASQAVSFSIPGTQELQRRYVGSGASLASKIARSIGIEARHHTESQIAAKEAAAAGTGNAGGKKHHARHHTESQIAAKQAAAAGGKKHHAREAEAQAPDEFGPWDTEEDEFGSWVDKREPHHTESQIAAKEAAAANGNTSGKKHHARHHTESQIAAKEAAAANNGAATGRKHHAREAEAQAPDEFGPWDTEEDEFGSWVDKREPHHTESQIAAKEAAAANNGAATGRKHHARHHTESQIAAKEAAAANNGAATGRKHHAREAEAQAPDEFGPWDTEEDEFGSWVDKREPHHTESQIAAKEAAAKKKGAKKGGN